MANFPIISASVVDWIFRTLFVLFLLLAMWSFFYPDRYREWNLRLFKRYRWVASPKHHEKMRTASVTKLRIQSGVIVIFVVLILLFSFKVLN